MPPVATEAPSMVTDDVTETTHGTPIMPVPKVSELRKAAIRLVAAKDKCGRQFVARWLDEHILPTVERAIDDGNGESYTEHLSDHITYPGGLKNMYTTYHKLFGTIMVAHTDSAPGSPHAAVEAYASRIASARAGVPTTVTIQHIGSSELGEMYDCGTEVQINTVQLN